MQCISNKLNYKGKVRYAPLEQVWSCCPHAPSCSYHAPCTLASAEMVLEGKELADEEAEAVMAVAVILRLIIVVTSRVSER